jgi:hypothetical protein
MTSKIGRPTDYRPEFARIAAKACKLGATDADLADFFGVHIRTIRTWITQHPTFHHALKVAKRGADERVQRSLYQRAIGYTFDAVKLFQHEGTVIREPYREHVPPDTTACIFWLKNRDPANWRDRREDGERASVYIERAIINVTMAPPGVPPGVRNAGDEPPAAVDSPVSAPMLGKPPDQ